MRETVVPNLHRVLAHDLMIRYRCYKRVEVNHGDLSTLLQCAQKQ